jgi:hypothetical protein
MGYVIGKAPNLFFASSGACEAGRGLGHEQTLSPVLTLFALPVMANLPAGLVALSNLATGREDTLKNIHLPLTEAGFTDSS